MNIIKVKILGDDGQAKGRAYTYKSDIPVSVGDKVVADMAGNRKTVEAVEVGLSESIIEGLDYEIKTILGLAEDFEGDDDGSNVDIEILEEQLPVIHFNFEELKSNLSESLSKYQGIVVTEQTLSGCKTTQKEIAGLKKKIDRYRIDKKKELSKPIAEFERQCKELVSLIESVEAPIKDGIKLYDDKKRNAKREVAVKLTAQVVGEIGLDEKHASRLEILDRYCNLTAKEPDVLSDITVRAQVLKAEQDKEKELLEIVEDAISAENEKINQKMQLSDFKRLMDAGATTKTILDEVRLRGSVIYEAENPKAEIEEPTKLPPEEPIPNDLPPVAAPPPEANKEPEDPECFVVYRVQGKLAALKRISEYLHSQEEIQCKTQQQGRLD